MHAKKASLPCEESISLFVEGCLFIQREGFACLLLFVFSVVSSASFCRSLSVFCSFSVAPVRVRLSVSSNSFDRLARVQLIG